MKMKMNDITYASIVPLIGGSTLAIKQELNKNPEYILSYKAFSRNESHLIDYLNVDIPYYYLDEKIPKIKSVDIVSTICPCAGLSHLNVNSSPDAYQNDWMYKTADFVLNKIKPKVFFGENAPSLITNKGIKVRNVLVEIARKYNYSFSIINTNSELHGLPQRRIRTFYFFWKSEKAPYMNYIKRENIGLKQFLKNIPNGLLYSDLQLLNKPLHEDDIYLFLKNKHFKNKSYEYIVDQIKGHTLVKYIIKYNLRVDFFKFIKGKNSPYVKMFERIDRKTDQNLNYWDASPSAVSNRTPAITGRAFVNLIHPYEERYINFRELMSLMGLPEDFKLNPKAKGKLPYNDICQNVSVNTARDQVKEIIKFLKNELEFSEHDYLLQDNIKQIAWYE